MTIMSNNKREALEKKLLPRFVENAWKSLDCGDGWLDLLEETDNLLSQLDPNYTISQVKEKFGGLRYYSSLSDEKINLLKNSQNVDEIKKLSQEFFDIIRQQENKSLDTCEVCGKFDDYAYTGPAYPGSRIYDEFKNENNRIPEDKFEEYVEARDKANEEYDAAREEWLKGRDVTTEATEGSYWVRTLCSDCRNEEAARKRKEKEFSELTQGLTLGESKPALLLMLDGKIDEAFTLANEIIVTKKAEKKAKVAERKAKSEAWLRENGREEIEA